MLFKKREYRYFVSYTGLDKDGYQHWGWVEAIRNKPITDFDSIKEMQNKINVDNKFTDFVIIFWRRFE